MPLEDADFRSLRKLLSPLLQNTTQRQYWLNEAFPTNQRLRTIFTLDNLDPDAFTQKLVLHLYEQNQALLIEFLQVIRDEEEGDRGQALQPYLDKLNAATVRPPFSLAAQPPETRKQLSAEEYLMRGLDKALNFDSRGAIADYTEALRLDPGFADAYYHRGSEHHDKGNYERAIADYSEAIRFDPQLAMAYSRRAFVRHNIMGDCDGAVVDYTEAIDLDPHDAFCYTGRGLARHDIYDNEGAIADYTEAIRLNPKDYYSYYNRGLARHDKYDYEGAIADYTEAIRLNPKYASAYYYSRGEARQKKGDQQSANEDFAEAKRLGYNE